MSFVKFGKFGNSQFLYFFKYFFSSTFFLFSFQDSDSSNSISFIIVREVPEAIFFSVSLLLNWITLKSVQLSNSLISCSVLMLSFQWILYFGYYIFQFQIFHLLLHNFNLFSKAFYFFHWSQSCLQSLLEAFLWLLPQSLCKLMSKCTTLELTSTTAFFHSRWDFS